MKGFNHTNKVRRQDEFELEYHDFNILVKKSAEKEPTIAIRGFKGEDVRPTSEKPLGQKVVEIFRAGGTIDELRLMRGIIDTVLEEIIRGIKNG